MQEENRVLKEEVKIPRSSLLLTVVRSLALCLFLSLSLSLTLYFFLSLSQSVSRTPPLIHSPLSFLPLSLLHIQVKTMKSSSLKLEAEFTRLENQIETSKIEARKLKDAIAERESERVRRRMKLPVGTRENSN